jgi:hypothetical protein
MRTTVDLADDVATEVARLRREKGLGLSEAVNELARAGLSARRAPYVYRQKTYDMGARVDLTNVADVLELLDEADRSESPRRAR